MNRMLQSSVVFVVALAAGFLLVPLGAAFSSGCEASAVVIEGNRTATVTVSPGTTTLVFTNDPTSRSFGSGAVGTFGTIDFPVELGTTSSITFDSEGGDVVISAIGDRARFSGCIEAQTVPVETTTTTTTEPPEEPPVETTTTTTTEPPGEEPEDPFGFIEPECGNLVVGAAPGEWLLRVEDAITGTVWFEDTFVITEFVPAFDVPIPELVNGVRARVLLQAEGYPPQEDSEFDIACPQFEPSYSVDVNPECVNDGLLVVNGSVGPGNQFLVEYDAETKDSMSVDAADDLVQHFRHTVDVGESTVLTVTITDIQRGIVIYEDTFDLVECVDETPPKTETPDEPEPGDTLPETGLTLDQFLLLGIGMLGLGYKLKGFRTRKS